MEGSVNKSKVIPASAMDAVKKTLYNAEQVKTHLLEFLSLADPELLAEMPPLERARSLFLLAKATTVLYTVKLRCSGVHPDEHPVKFELERISVYQEKLQRLVDSNQAPSRPSTTLNYQAATRFIDHSLPNLTPEQRQNMKDIMRGEGPRIKYTERSVQKKRKFPSSERQTVQTAANEFLEKASRELLGDAQGTFEQPIQIDDSDEEDHPMS